MNEVEIVITSKNRSRPGIEAAKRDVASLGATFQKLNSTIRKSMVQTRASIKKGVSDATRDAERDVDRGGRSIGRRLTSGIVDAMSTGTSAVSDALSSTVRTAASAAGPVLIGVLVGALAGALPAALAGVGALAGGALVMGIGAGFVGLGATLLLQNEKIKKEFAKTGKEIQQIMQDSSKPLLPVMEFTMSRVKSLVKEFNPTFKQVFKDAEVPLKNLVDSFMTGIKKLKPAVAPIMTAFTSLANAIDWEGLFQDISDALVDLSHTVVANKSTIASVFDLVLQVIPLVINAMTTLIGIFATMQGHGRALALAWSTAFGGVTTTILGFAEKVLLVLRTIGQAISTIPGMEGIGQAMVAGIDQALVKVNEWKTSVQEASRGAKLRVDISELTTQIDQAKAELMDPELSKEREAQINANITQLLQKKSEAITALGDPKLIKEYRSSINAEIGTLKSRLAEARKELKDPNLTKTRKAKLNADIASLTAAVARARAALNSLKNRTVTVTVRTERQEFGGLKSSKGRAHGGIVGSAQTGGVRNAQTLVGESGPEIVELPFGSTVVPAGETRNRQLRQQNANAFGSSSMSFGGASKVVQPMQEVVEAVKDVAREIVSLRDSFSKSTGNIFDQERAYSSYQAAIDNATKSLKENKKTLNIGTEKGRANRNALLEMASAAQEVATSMDELNKSPQAIYERMKLMRAEFIKMARSFGLSSKQARDLADKYGLSPGTAKRAAEKRNKDEAYNKALEKKQKLAGMAHGGIAGGLTVVGEHGPEIAKLPFGSYVNPSNRSRSMVGGGGGSEPVVIEIKSGGSKLEDLLTEILRKSVRDRGGNVQLVLGRN